ncbi:ferredoxin [Frankia sp. Hr75.2]|nr:ferredoxin [Frankia sp. Hr75.2]
MTGAHIDTDICGGHGLCASIAPDLFEVNESGLGVVRMPDIPPELVPDLEGAIASCPAAAISRID